MCLQAVSLCDSSLVSVERCPNFRGICKALGINIICESYFAKFLLFNGDPLVNIEQIVEHRRFGAL